MWPWFWEARWGLRGGDRRSGLSCSTGRLPRLCPRGRLWRPLTQVGNSACSGEALGPAFLEAAKKLPSLFRVIILPIPPFRVIIVILHFTQMTEARGWPLKGAGWSPHPLTQRWGVSLASQMALRSSQKDADPTCLGASLVKGL